MLGADDVFSYDLLFFWLGKYTRLTQSAFTSGVFKLFCNLNCNGAFFFFFFFTVLKTLYNFTYIHTFIVSRDRTFDHWTTLSR